MRGTGGRRLPVVIVALALVAAYSGGLCALTGAFIALCDYYTKAESPGTAEPIIVEPSEPVTEEPITVHEEQIAWGHLVADTWSHMHGFVNWTDQGKYLMIRIKQNRKCEQIYLHHIFVRNGLDVLEHASHLNRLELIVDNVQKTHGP